MDLQKITPEWVEKILEAFRKKQSLMSQEVDEPLDCLAAFAPQDYDQALKDLLYTQIAKELSRYRRKHNITPLEENGDEHQKKMIEQDARQNDPRLIVWTFMYYRYVSGDLSIKEVSLTAKYSTDNHRLKIKQGYEALARFLYRCESDAHAALRTRQLQEQLGEAEYAEYIGMDEPLERLVYHLRDPEGPHWISLEGLGGIGKTALARRVTEELVKQDESLRIFWLSARQQRFDPVDGTLSLPKAAFTAEDLIDQLWQMALLQTDTPLNLDEKIVRLADWSSHLHGVIVIDNLETLEDVAAIRYFSSLAKTARFLITSRESLAWMSSVMVYPLQQLSPRDSEALLIREYHERKTSFLKKKNPSYDDSKSKQMTIPLKDEHFEQIQKTVGGFPLALKLIAAQILTMPIDDCLAGLRHIAPQTRSEEMFTYIYRQTWMLLSVEARLLLLAIHDALPPEGMPLEWLETLALAADLSSEQFEALVQQLHDYSLLETTPRDKRFCLHRLTVTFLQNEFRSDQAWEQV